MKTRLLILWNYLVIFWESMIHVEASIHETYTRPKRKRRDTTVVSQEDVRYVKRAYAFYKEYHRDMTGRVEYRKPTWAELLESINLELGINKSSTVIREMYRMSDEAMAVLPLTREVK